MPQPGTPAADLTLTAELVLRLIQEQHPDLGQLPLRHAASGWDNDMFRLGDHLCVRLPRRAVAAPLLLNEQRWLPVLAPALPLPIPSPVRLGRPSAAFPFSWSVVPWFAGSPCDDRDPGAKEALQLAQFLRALHRPAPADAPRNPVRGCALADRAAALEPRRQRVRAQTALFGAAVRQAWEQALAAPIDVAPTWIHGDLHPRNILARGGRLSAVIDWGDLAAGDRATDLACIWMVLPQADLRARALREYGAVSQATLLRARGWAVLLGTLLLDTGLAGDEGFKNIGERALRRVAVGP